MSKVVERYTKETKRHKFSSLIFSIETINFLQITEHPETSYPRHENDEKFCHKRLTLLTYLLSHRHKQKREGRQSKISVRKVKK